MSPQVREPRPTTRGSAQAEYVHERGLAVGIEAAAACHLVLAENWVEALDGAPSRALGGEAPSRAPDGAPHDEAPYRAPVGAPSRAPDGAPHRDPNTGNTYLVRPIWNGSAWVEAPPPPPPSATAVAPSSSTSAPSAAAADDDDDDELS